MFATRKAIILAAVTSQVLACWIPSAVAQVAWVADANKLVSVDLAARPTLISQPIPDAKAYSIAILPGGATAWVVDEQEFLQSINLADRTISNIELPRWRGAGQIAITPDGTKAYLPIGGTGGTVIPIDLVSVTTYRVMPSIGNFAYPQYPYGIAIAPNGKTAYVSDRVGGKVVAIDIATGTVGQAFPVSNPKKIAVTPDGKKLYVANALTPPTVTSINLENAQSNQITFRDVSSQTHAADELAIDPDGQTVYVTGDRQLLRIHIGLDQEDDPIPLGLSGNNPPIAKAVAVSPDGKTVYVGAGSDIVPINMANDRTGDPITGFSDVTSIAFAPPPYNGYDNKVYFLGDSVTAGFGYCGPDEGGLVFGCDVNSEFANSWWNPGKYSLGWCAPPQAPQPPTNNCSNNNYKGKPWSAPNEGMWVPSPNAPTVAYSYQIAIDQGDADPPYTPAEIRNWAMTGSIPAQWDPGGISMDGENLAPGVYADQLKKIRNSYVVLTLGANPLLGDYLHIIFGIPGLAELNLGTRNFDCASTTVVDGVPAPLSAEKGGVGECLLQQWWAEKQAQHLYNIYNTLLRNGNRVAVVGYPYVCPWSFGTWQPTIDAPLGPSRGNPCNTQNKQPGGITQEDQAFFLGDIANGLISAITRGYRNPNIIFVPQSDEWRKHQQYHEHPWIFANDTWIHPNRGDLKGGGHRAIATAVEAAMCAAWNRWCKTGHGDDVKW